MTSSRTMMMMIFEQRARDVRACLFYLSCRGRLVDAQGLCYFCRDFAETTVFDLDDASHSVCCACARRLVAVGWRCEDNLENRAASQGGNMC